MIDQNLNKCRQDCTDYKYQMCQRNPFLTCLQKQSQAKLKSGVDLSTARPTANLPSSNRFKAQRIPGNNAAEQSSPSVINPFVSLMSYGIYRWVSGRNLCDSAIVTLLHWPGERNPTMNTMARIHTQPMWQVGLRTCSPLQAPATAQKTMLLLPFCG